MIAQELALRHPERLRALALGATNASYLVSRKPSLSAMVDFVTWVARGRGNSPGMIGRLLTTPDLVVANPDVVGAWFLRSDHARPLAALTRLVILRGAGHVFPLEQEEQTARALVEHFLAPVPG